MLTRNLINSSNETSSFSSCLISSKFCFTERSLLISRIRSRSSRGKKLTISATPKLPKAPTSSSRPNRFLESLSNALNADSNSSNCSGFNEVCFRATICYNSVDISESLGKRDRRRRLTCFSMKATFLSNCASTISNSHLSPFAEFIVVSSPVEELTSDSRIGTGTSRERHSDSASSSRFTSCCNRGILVDRIVRVCSS